MILISKYLVPKGYTGVAIYPFVFLKHYKLKTDEVLVNHEYIHLKQQLELLVIPFYMFYGFEFLIRLLQYRRWKTAYRNISFEREAYINESNLEYLERRKAWQFLKYLRANDF
jgi:hypothetical protein